MKCSNILCKNEGSKLKCPICVKMNKTVPYCSQDCFKKDWKNHKKLCRSIHKRLFI